MASKDDVLVAVGTRGTFTDALDREGIPWKLIPSLGKTHNPFALLRARRELAVFVAEERPDIVMTHSTHAIAILGAVPPGRRVAVIHGWSIASAGAPWPMRSIARWIYRFLLRQADVLIFVCAADQRYGSAHGLIPSHAKVHILKNVLGPSPLSLLSRNEARKVLGIAPGTFVAGTIARLAKQKRIDRLFAATQDPAWPNEAVALVLGQGPLARSLAKQTNDRCRLRTDLTEPTQYLRAFDAFALTSDYEGLPFSILEAGAAGLPVIATDVGGLREVLDDGNAGIIVPRTDVRGIARAVARLVKHPTHAHVLGAALQERVRTHYTEARPTV
jgi:glycosyltransferase involved in cell wall biosynthesis